MKILIADESPLIRKLIIEILGSENNEFAECEDSKHIPEIYTSFHPNFLIVDFELTGTNCSLLEDKYPESKIIITSDYNEKDVLENENRKSIHGFVMKENLMVLKNLVMN
jgi:DNA-binding NarL/FixJ family response regulator